jgi:hypothetical protein
MIAVYLTLIAFALPLLAPLAMPNLKWLAACALIIGSLIAGFQAWDEAQLAAAMSRGYTGSPGDAFAPLLVVVAVGGLLLGVVIRLVAHLVRHGLVNLERLKAAERRGPSPPQPCRRTAR